MGGAEPHRILVIGGRKARNLVPLLEARGFAVSYHDSVRHAFRQGRRLDAQLAIIGPRAPDMRPATLCWRTRMSGFCGRTIVLLARDDETSASDLHRAGADATLEVPVGERQLIRETELSIRHGRSSWPLRVRLGELELDFREHAPRLQERVLRLRPLAFEALSYVALYGEDFVPWPEIGRQILGEHASIASARHLMRWACAGLGDQAVLIERIHGQGCRRNPMVVPVFEAPGVVDASPLR